ncbi:MAG: hypothetical protein JXB47_08170 [Anaerolineae bacterium]|nr:hypothetical protein [Anaerolineae bacterium]
MDTTQCRLWPWLVPILLLTAWLGARGLDADAIWYDEWASYYNAGGAHYGPLAPGAIIERIAADNYTQTPAYYFVLAGWGAFAGWTTFAVRALSLLIGLAATAWTYRLGRDLIAPGAGLLAAAAMGTSAFFVEYLHEARPYTLYALLVVVNVWLYWRLVFFPPLSPALSPTRGERESARRRGAFLLTLSAALALYTHYFTIFVFIALGLYHLLFAPKTRAWWRAPVAMGAGGLLFVPWLGVLLSAVSTNLRTSDPSMALGTAELIGMLGYGLGNGIAAPLTIIVWGAAVFERGRAVRFVGFLALGVAGMVVALNALLPIVINLRYLMALLPLTALLFGAGAARSARLHRLAPTLILAIWTGAGVWHSLTPAFSDTLFTERHQALFRRGLPLDRLADALHEQAQTGDVLALHTQLIAGPIMTSFQHYMYDVPVKYLVTSGDNVFEGYAGQARSFLGDAPRVWLAAERHNVADPPPNVMLAQFEQVLAEDGYVYCRRALDLDTLHLDLYAAAPVCCGPPEDIESAALARFGDSVTLTHLSATVTVEAADSTLAVLSAWSGGDKVPPYTYSVALHVFDADGKFVSQADFGLPVEAYGCYRARIPLDGLAPGVYTLTGTVYNWRDGTPLPAEALHAPVEPGEQRHQVILNRFTITITTIEEIP